jgi:hypothetical protein
MKTEEHLGSYNKQNISQFEGIKEICLFEEQIIGNEIHRKTGMILLDLTSSY